MAPKMKFTEGEKVLCFHGPLLYEAKCIKHQVKDKQVKYFIHYSGWNKNWDEWVPESRVLKHNEANLQKQMELEKAHLKTKKTKATKVTVKKEPTDKERTTTSQAQEKPEKKKVPAAVSTTTQSSENTSEAQRKKRTRADQNADTEEEFVQKTEVKVKIPEDLKIWLVDDYDLINHQKKLVHLPARVTAEHVLGEYVKQKVAEKGMTLNKETAVKEITNGIREYFNVMLGKQLLYKFERPQYQDILGEFQDKPMSEIYGAIHLLRLFTMIGDVISYTPLMDESVTLLMNHFQSFVIFMSKSSNSFLNLEDYEIAPPEYHRRAV